MIMGKTIYASKITIHVDNKETPILDTIHIEMPVAQDLAPEVNFRERASLEVLNLIDQCQAKVLNYSEIKTLGWIDIESYGFYNFLSDYIAIGPKAIVKTKSDLDMTILHELVHWTSHTSRLNRDIINLIGTVWLTSKKIHTEEAVAHYGMVLLTKELGIWSEFFDAELEIYLATLINRDDAKARRKAQDAVNYIMNLVQLAKVA